MNYYDEAVRLHFEEGYCKDRIAKILPIGHTTVCRWIADYVAENGKQYPPSMKRKKNKESTMRGEPEALRRRILELEGRLKYQEMRTEAFDTMIEIAEKRFGITIRK